MPCMLRCVTMMMPVATDETFPFPSFSYAEVRLPAQYNALPRAVSRAGGRATRSSRRRRRGRVKSAIGVCAASDIDERESGRVREVGVFVKCAAGVL